MAPMWNNKKRWRDYGNDLCISRSHKKTRLNHDGLESTHCPSHKEEILVRDADYKLFLKLLNVDDESDGEEEDDFDPDYKRFLGHSKADKKSYTYERKKEDGRSVCIKYEIWDESLNDTDKGRIPARNVSSRENLRSMPNGEREFQPSSTADMEFSPVDDDSYKEFIRKLRQNEESMFFEHNDHVVGYESGNEISSDVGSEIGSEVEQECAPYYSRKKFQQSPSPDSLGSSMDEDDCICIESLSASSQYREELMRVLRMPYSEREYRDLIDLVCINKPLVKTREVRGRTVSYPTNEISLSYFDHFDDFKQVFDSTPSDRKMRLNLLRGFIYYLKRLAHEGAFKPWLNRHCMKIKPGSK